ncbi:DNA polymerase III subunit delta [Janibacter cremeus]|uniref:DNA polymerase III subunit delta n=1 Tax=Janibacter cremeus TaxID=1285192 RepID=UPI0023F73DF1|nr:DNA polymerase III subunit delta [Janibacter cremeus]WEV79395.1 DNA polymerase III subunit delta [Janibacter cremeus]
MSSRVAPFVLVSGPEEVLADRAVEQVIADVRVGTPEVDVVTLTAEDYTEGELTVQASPSLFGEDKLIIVRDLHQAPDALQIDLLNYLADPADSVTLVVTHASGNKGKKVLDTLKKAKAHVIQAPAIKSDRDKAEFVTNEFRTSRRKATPEAVQALVEAVGKDVRELASACKQLVDDTTGTIDADVVERYHGGRVEATGFKVADATVAGRTGEALRLLRHAVDVGVDPVPIVAVIAMQLRQLAKVGGAGRGRSADLARDLGMAPWQIDKARRALQGWSGDALGRSIQAIAAADVEVKGGGRDPVYSVERAILTISRERNGS